MTCGIYQIVNKVNGKRYVGSSVDIERRWKTHIKQLQSGNHHSILMQRAWDKYGEGNFTFSVIEECDLDAVLDKEQLHIDQGCEYNICKVAGSNAGTTWTEDQKAKHRQSKKQFYKDNPEVREKISKSGVISHARPEVRRRISDRTREAQKCPDVRAKMSEARRIQWKDEEYKRDQSERARFNINRPEHKAALAKANNAPRNKTIYEFTHPDHGERICTQFDLKKEFKNLRSSKVSSICSGANKSHMGWRLKEKAPN